MYIYYTNVNIIEYIVVRSSSVVLLISLTYTSDKYDHDMPRTVVNYMRKISIN